RATLSLPALAAAFGDDFEEALAALTALLVTALDLTLDISSDDRRAAARPIALGPGGLADWAVAQDAAAPAAPASVLAAKLARWANAASTDLAARLGPCAERAAVAAETLAAPTRRGEPLGAALAGGPR